MTLRDVADAAGVSTATVSHVLNGTMSVTDGVRTRVEAAAKSLGYQGNRSARALRTGRTQMFGLLLPDLTNPFFPALAQAIEKRARREDYALILVDCGGDKQAQRRGLKLLAEHGVDGLVWIPLPGTVERPDSGRPTVVLGRSLPGVDTLVSDDEAGGRLVGERATRLGHRRVLYLGGPRSETATVRRRAGLIQGLGDRARLVAELNVPFATSLPAAARRALVSTDATYVACASDVIAIGALKVLAQAGRRVPADVSVSGFDNIAWSELVTPMLTTVAPQYRKIGTTAVELLLERLKRPELPSRDRVLSVSLIVRASDGEAPTTMGDVHEGEE